MNQFLRDRILRKLDTISDERAYQVLDFVEFLESKYAERQNPSANVFQPRWIRVGTLPIASSPCRLLYTGGRTAAWSGQVPTS